MQNASETNMPLPLQGIRVVDVTQNVAGPYAGMILADLGAEVIKVEPSSGDAAREWGPPFWGTESTTFLALNRNKKSLFLDLKDRSDSGTLLGVLKRADIFLESSRPGAMKRLGLDYTLLHERFPKLIYAELTAFGETGPKATEAGYDPLMQAMCGIMSVTGSPGQAPIRVGVSIVDMAAGMWTAMAVISALRLREKTGKGHRIGVSLYETAIAWMAIHFASYWGTGQSPIGWGSGVSMISPYEAFPTSDGWVIIAAGNDGLFKKLCEVIARREWLEDERFRSNSQRVKNRSELRELVSEITKREKTDYWLTQLGERGIPVAPIKDTKQITEDEQFVSTGIAQSSFHPDIPGFKSIGLPISFDGSRPPLRMPPPTKKLAEER